jgi:hypothetical protein
MLLILKSARVLANHTERRDKKREITRKVSQESFSFAFTS